ncbi:MAG: cytidylate kinase-like family protein [Clostridia bacterium]|nr:cytidylate kinase-like family protein [Clostridia bacterium]MBQ3033890.1 cytidylate kinase-like family protein [Deferribacterales bacterium]
MKENTVITIGRQFGSGGHEIATAVAEALSIPYYDKEIIVEAAKKTGLDENLFKNAEERTMSSFLYSVALGAYSPASNVTGMPFMNLNETIFRAQSKVISDFAEKGSCVFVGRCADHILKDHPACCRIFVYANLKDRIDRIQKLYKLSAGDAEDLINKTDKKRASFYSYYTGQKWHNLQNYDLCLNSAKLGIAGSVEAILAYIRQL